MTILFLIVAFLLGAAFGAMFLAAIMLAAAVSKRADQQPETIFEGK